MISLHGSLKKEGFQGSRWGFLCKTGSHGMLPPAPSRKAGPQRAARIVAAMGNSLSCLPRSRIPSKPSTKEKEKLASRAIQPAIDFFSCWHMPGSSIRHGDVFIVVWVLVAAIVVVVVAEVAAAMLVQAEK